MKGKRQERVPVRCTHCGTTWSGSAHECNGADRACQKCGHQWNSRQDNIAAKMGLARPKCPRCKTTWDDGRA